MIMTQPIAWRYDGCDHCPDCAREDFGASLGRADCVDFCGRTVTPRYAGDVYDHDPVEYDGYAPECGTCGSPL
jgi:hypothetical protein